MQFTCFLIVGSLAVFSNIIVNGLGFSVRQTQLLNLAQGGWSVLIYISESLSRIVSGISELMGRLCLVGSMDETNNSGLDLLYE